MIDQVPSVGAAHLEAVGEGHGVHALVLHEGLADDGGLVEEGVIHGAGSVVELDCAGGSLGLFLGGVLLEGGHVGEAVLALDEDEDAGLGEGYVRGMTKMVLKME